MSPNVGGASTSRKRKNKEVVSGENAADFLPQVQRQDPPHLQTNSLLHGSEVSTDLTLKNPNNDKSLHPFRSVTALLTSDRADARLSDHIHQMQQLINAHTDHMQSSLSNMMRSQYHATTSAAEEAMGKRLKEKDVELNNEKQIAEKYRTESERWMVKAKALEQTVSSLKVALRNTLEDASVGWKKPCCVWCQSELKEEDGESSYVPPPREEGAPPQLPCNICRKQSATVMIWPCRHVTVCVQCEKLTEVCPLCRSPKDSCLDVFVA